MQTVICDKCGREIFVGAFPFCPHGTKGEVSFNAVGDEYPGGVWIENLGPHPIKVYSESERRAIMKRRKLVEFIRHTGVPGTDKSPVTTNWDVGPSKDGRPLCMLSLEERAERRKEAAERLGITVEQLELISGALESLTATRYDEDDMEPRDGGEIGRTVIQNRFSKTVVIKDGE